MAAPASAKNAKTKRRQAEHFFILTFVLKPVPTLPIRRGEPVGVGRDHRARAANPRTPRRGGGGR